MRTGGTGARRRVAAGVIAVVGGVAAIGGCALRSRSEAAFCDQLKVVRDLDEVLAGGDAERTAARVDELRALERSAPEPIEPQVATLVAVTDDLARTMASNPDPDAAAGEVFARRQGELSDITAAGRAVETYATEHCQLQLNPAGAVSSGDPATTTTAPPTTAPVSTRAASTRAPSTRATRASTTTRRSASTRSTRSTPTTRRATTTRSRASTTTTRRR